ncbi:hypothetical protein ACFW5W_35150 [Streptomyces sp. NPDC058783]|uniref:hypothetical protein n=1 Tax=Streptomyces sp. NPDC058783 TaxID=3346633 RepID=UPI0036A1FA10
MLTARPHNREQLGRDRLDLVLLHNPEHAHLGARSAPHRTILDASADPEEAGAAGHVTAYGIATWAGLYEEACTVGWAITITLPTDTSPTVRLTDRRKRL